MTEQVKYQPGDKIDVWLAGRWVKAIVVDHFHWTHSSGNTFVSYRIDIGSGMIYCGNNSIQQSAEQA